jgi:hypothetical protein
LASAADSEVCSERAEVDKMTAAQPATPRKKPTEEVPSVRVV